jgi:hypothetical protein
MDIIDKLIVSDVITRSQYYDSRKGQDDDAPLRRLMLAVLRDALACLSSGASGSASNPQRKEARDAAEWIGNKTDESLFSFNGICETLSIHPDALRESLDDWLASGPRLMRRSPVVPETAVRATQRRALTRS